MARGAGERRVRHAEIGHLFGGQQPGLFAISTGGQQALIADEDAAIRRSRTQVSGHLQGLVGFVVEDAAGDAVIGGARRARVAASRLHLILRGEVAEPFVLGDSSNFGALLHAIVPKHRDGAHGTASWKVKAGHRFLRKLELTGAFLHHALHAGGRAEFKGHVGGTQDVAGHVAQRAAAEVEEAAPVEGQVEAAVGRFEILAACGEGPLFGGAEPKVPVERGRDGFGGGNFGLALGPPRPVSPGMHLFHLADFP